MKYRVSRSFCVLTELVNRSSATKETRFMRFVEDESSDDEGGLPLSRPKIYIRRKPVVLKLGSMSQYQGFGGDQDKYTHVMCMCGDHNVLYCT